MNVDKFIRETLANKIEEAVAEIRNTILHPDNEPNVTLYPKTSIDQVEQLAEQLNYIKTGLIKDTLIGKDGIVIDKAADSEKIEISGKNFPHAPYSYIDGRQILIYNVEQKKYGARLLDDGSLSVGNIPFYRDPAGATKGYLNKSLYTGDPKSDYAAANKKYVDDAIANIGGGGKLYQHTYTFEAGTGNYVYCTTYKNSNTPMTVAEVINFFKSDPSVGKVVNVCVVNNGTTVGSGYFFDAGEGIDYTVIVLNSSADFIINADTNMTPNIIEL